MEPGIKSLDTRKKEEEKRINKKRKREWEKKQLEEL